MPIVRSREYHKTFLINTDDILKYGWQKAIILSNVEKFNHIPKDELHLHFPFIDSYVFYQHINWLITEKLITEDHES